MILEVPVDPVPASRPRVTRAGFSYYAEPYKSFKRELHAAFEKLWAGKELIADTRKLTISIIKPRPKTTKLPYPKPDVDNYAKAVMDAMNGTVFVDDWLVQCLAVSKRWAKPGESGKVIVSIEAP